MSTLGAGPIRIRCRENGARRFPDEPGGTGALASPAYLHGSDGAITPEPPEERPDLDGTGSLDPAAGRNEAGRRATREAAKEGGTAGRGTPGGPQPARPDVRTSSLRRTCSTDEGAPQP
jgi:hypothetical protein